MRAPGSAFCKRSPALGRGLHLAALALASGRVGHGVGLVEHDGAVEGVPAILVEVPGEPAHDLVEP